MIEASVVDSAGKEKRIFDEKYRQELINKMSNWQRGRWACAGYPQKQNEIEKFLKMTKENLYDGSNDTIPYSPGPLIMESFWNKLPEKVQEKILDQTK